MLGQGFGGQRLQPLQPAMAEQSRVIGDDLCLFQGDLVQQLAQFQAQRPGMFGAGRAAHLARELGGEAGQHGLAAQRIHRGRQAKQGGQGQLIRILHREPRQRPQPGQQQGGRIRLAQEGGLECPGRAAGGQQNGGGRQCRF